MVSAVGPADAVAGSAVVDEEQIAHDCLLKIAVTARVTFTSPTNGGTPKSTPRSPSIASPGRDDPSGIVSGMPTRKEVLRIADRDVTITNPDKVYFPEAGHTKLDLVQYYLAVAAGALVGAGGRPMALKRFVDGAAGDFFFQKRAPENRPDFLRVATLSFPSGRTADEIVVDDAAGLAWIANLGCIDLNPHPVRAEDLDHPDELRIDLDPVPGVPWSQIREVALVAREALAGVGLVGWPKTSGSRGIHINVRIEPRWTYPEVRRAALAIARDVERRAPEIATVEVVEGGAPRRVPRLQPERQGPDRGLGLLGPAHARCARVHAAAPGRTCRRSRRRRSPWRRCRRCSRSTATRAPGSTTAVGSLEALLELSARDEAEGLGDAPWPPNYRKQPGEPPRVQPSKQRRPDADYDTPEAEAEREKSRAAMERRFARAAEERGSFSGTRPTPTGRRRSSIPVIEIARAAKKDDALAGLERWKARWPTAAGALEAADVLVDSMRGRSTTWTRIRVNLTHVPEADRPPRRRSTPTTTR